MQVIYVRDVDNGMVWQAATQRREGTEKEWFSRQLPQEAIGSSWHLLGAYTLELARPRGEGTRVLLHQNLSIWGWGLSGGMNSQALLACTVLDISPGTRYRCWLLDSQNSHVQRKRPGYQPCQNQSVSDLVHRVLWL